MKAKRFLVGMACVLFLFALVPVTARAGVETSYIDETGQTQTVDATPYNGQTELSGWYVVDGSYTVNSTITTHGDVCLILADGCSLVVNAQSGPGIYVFSLNSQGLYSSLTIYGQENGTGALTATGNNGVGIGGMTVWSSGNITINGGTVTATGKGNFSAGIGGGSSSQAGTTVITVGTITINGGTVIANGSGNGAGIGCGDNLDATVVINGGTVTATGGSMTAFDDYGNVTGSYCGGAGIGSGSGGDGTATINGGTVTATGGAGSAGIGGGFSGSGTVAINGGTVTANGGTEIVTDYDSGAYTAITGGAGIGGGYLGSGTVTISGGTVTASGGVSAAGIGGGYASSGTVAISGGSVNAYGNATIDIDSKYSNNVYGISAIDNGSTYTVTGSGAGIGAGYHSSGTVTISGGTVTAASGYNAAGIGGGWTGNGTVTISGGSVNASGYAAIGGGLGGIGNPTNGAGQDVYLNVLTLPGAGSGTTVMAGSIGGVTCAVTPDAANGVYGIRGVKTDASGKVYFYLPASTAQESVRLSTNSTVYTAEYLRSDSGSDVTMTALTNVSFTAAQSGGASITADSTSIVLTFSQAVAGLSVDDIIVTDSTVSVTTGSLSGSGTTWTLALTAVSAEGSVNVAIADFGTFHVTTDTQSVTVHKDTRATPGAPQNFSASPGDSQVELSWTAPASVGGSAITKYEVSCDGGATWAEASGAARHTFTGLTNGQSYTFLVRAVNAVGAGESASVTAAPQADYIARTLADSATGITVSGSLIHRSATLTVGALTLDAAGTCTACDTIRSRMADDNYLLVLGKDVSLSQGFRGTLTITVPVDAKYNGKQVSILHCADGVLETRSSTVENGKAVFTVTSLSPIAVFAAADTGTNSPQTGDTGAGIWLDSCILALMAFTGTLAAASHRRRRGG